MTQMIFVNLPVKDVVASTEFYTGLGFARNDQFSDENVSSMVVSDTIVLMLLAEPFFKSFTPKELGDVATTSSSTVCLSRESRAAVDEITEKALASGGTFCKEPMDEGFMYGRSFFDPTGHLIEVMWMDPSMVQ